MFSFTKRRTSNPICEDFSKSKLFGFLRMYGKKIALHPIIKVAAIIAIVYTITVIALTICHVL